MLVITSGTEVGDDLGMLITAEGHTTARERGITALDCRR